MEEMNTNLVEEVMEVVEPAEILDNVDVMNVDNSITMAEGIAVATAALTIIGAGVYGVRKFIKSRKAKKAASSEQVVEIEKVEEVQPEQEPEEN